MGHGAGGCAAVSSRVFCGTSAGICAEVTTAENKSLREIAIARYGKLRRRRASGAAALQSVKTLHLRYHCRSRNSRSDGRFEGPSSRRPVNGHRLPSIRFTSVAEHRG